MFGKDPHDTHMVECMCHMVREHRVSSLLHRTDQKLLDVKDLIKLRTPHKSRKISLKHLGYSSVPG